jgi:hypothetical protein
MFVDVLLWLKQQEANVKATTIRNDTLMLLIVGGYGGTMCYH